MAGKGAKAYDRIRERIARGVAGAGNGTDPGIASGRTDRTVAGNGAGDNASDSNERITDVSHGADENFGPVEPTIVTVGEFEQPINPDGNRTRRNAGGGATSNGTSNRVERGGSGNQRKRKTTQAQAQQDNLEEDCADVRNIIVGIFDGLANMTRFDGFACSEEEANTIAKPAARIMARHGFTEQVRKVSDPAALMIAAFTVTAPRLAAYKIWKQVMQENIEAEIVKRRQSQNGNANVTPINRDQPVQGTGFSVGSIPN